MSAAPFEGDTHNQKDHVFGFLRRSFACRTHLIESAVTPSLVAETRKLGYQVYSLFTISNIARGRSRSRSSKTIPDEALPSGGARRDRTDDLMLAKHALSQLSYGPNLG